MASLQIILSTFVILVLFLVLILMIIDILKGSFKYRLSKVLWIIVLTFLPIAGMILYYYLGKKTKNEHI